MATGGRSNQRRGGGRKPQAHKRRGGGGGASSSGARNNRNRYNNAGRSNRNHHDNDNEGEYAVSAFHVGANRNYRPVGGVQQKPGAAGPRKNVKHWSRGKKKDGPSRKKKSGTSNSGSLQPIKVRSSGIMVRGFQQVHMKLLTSS